jgi:SSS family solute:Na+ symporter
VFFKRLNAKGCLSALVVGFLLGAFRLAVDTPVSLGMSGYETGYATGSFLWIVNNVYFQYYSLFIFVVSTAAMFVVSYLTEVPSLGRLTGLTYATVTAEHRAESRRSWNQWDVISSGIVLALILAAYMYFTG